MEPLARTWRLARPLDLRATLGPTLHGPQDPTTRWVGADWWRASRTPEGPATLRVSCGADRVAVRAWGPGAAWALHHAPRLLGEDGEPDRLSADQGLVGRLRRASPGLRLCRTDAVMEALVPLILEQKVTSVEAQRSWRRLAVAWGEAAPGPAGQLGVRLPPPPERLADAPYWQFHDFGVERKRADIVRRAARVARQLEQVVEMDKVAGYRRLTAVAGIGPWTAGLVGQVVLGDADAVVTGDYHFPHIVSYSLIGERRGSDERMLELLEPYRPWRGVAQRLLVTRGRRPERRAPRARLRDLRAI